MRHALDLASSAIASLLRGGAGGRVAALGRRPAQPLELYEFEACPFCRKVREALSALDVDAIIYPCPKNGPRFRPEVVRLGGKAQFPYLVDRNTGRELYESDDIVSYLFAEYGAGERPLALRLGPLTDLSSFAASLVRPAAGAWYLPARAPAQPLALWSFEASPQCRLVRERLCALEISYLLHNVARGSPRCVALGPDAPEARVPYLEDPNSETGLSGSSAINAYLDRTYRS
ncbi:MAG: glutathione S-transferase N-terminal domain-containing protein [Candidatus Binatia bacterium]